MKAKKGEWAMWAHREKATNGEEPMYTHASEDKGWVEMHGLDVPVVAVSVRESPKGEYYGWIDKGDTVPAMIWQGRMLFGMCFPYGPEVEEKAGRGRVVRLDVKESP